MTRIRSVLMGRMSMVPTPIVRLLRRRGNTEKPLKRLIEQGHSSDSTQTPLIKDTQESFVKLGLRQVLNTPVGQVHQLPLALQEMQ